MSGADPPKRVVWVLGSGFSVPLGGPLLADLLSERSAEEIAARYEREKYPRLEEAEATSVRNLFQYGRGEKDGFVGRRPATWLNAEDFLDYLDTAAEERHQDVANRLAGCSDNREDEHDKGTKTKAARRFAMEPAVVPPIKAMHDEHRSAGGHVIALPNDKHLARDFRQWLDEAEVNREELHASTPTRKSMTFHDLRATGLTWLAVRGEDPLKIMQRAGHTDFGTTQGYIRTAEAVREGFGDVFPPLPAALLAQTIGPTSRQVRGIIVEALGSHGPESAGPLVTIRIAAQVGEADDRESEARGRPLFDSGVDVAVRQSLEHAGVLAGPEEGHLARERGPAWGCG
jgi:hypothetical protein